MKLFPKLSPKLSAVLLVILIAGSAAKLADAEAQPQQDWVPRGIEAVRKSASSKTDFTLDHSMLVIAAKLDKDNEDLRRVIAGVNGVTVHSYRFPGAWTYDAQALSSVKDEYHAAGWKQVLNNHEKDGGPGSTEVWVRFENNAISSVAVLLEKSSEVDFIAISGSISPLDLVRLGGHFGIPKIEGGVTVPNTGPRP
jgi:hypothetical protein